MPADMSGNKRKRAARVLLVLLAAAALAAGGYLAGRHAGGEKTAAGLPPSSGRAADPHRVLFYRNPMNPAITSPVPAKDEMGMDYLPVYADEAKTGAAKKSLAQKADDFFSDAAPQAPPPGLAPVTLDSNALALAGVRTAQAQFTSFTKDVRAVGRIVPDESRLYRVQTKIRGWVETLDVSVTGQSVRKGERLLSLYSPELVASQEEFLKARDAAAALRSSPDPETRRLGEGIMEAARRRLALFDVPASFIRSLESSGRARRTVEFTAPVSGVVLEKGVTAGQLVEPGTVLFSVADLKRVWVEADFYEDEARLLKEGMEARVTSPYDPALSLPGKIIFLVPFLKADSRTLTARFSFANPGLALKPGMYVNVYLAVGLGRSVVVPDTALIRTGTRTVAFVEKDKGLFEPREVSAGVESDGLVQVLSGIAAGERVAVSANFLLDSESRLSAVIGAASGSSSGGGK